MQGPVPMSDALKPPARLGLLAATLLLHWGLLAVFLGSGPAPAPDRQSRTMDIILVAAPPPVTPPPPVLVSPPARARSTGAVRVRPQRRAAPQASPEAAIQAPAIAIQSVRAPAAAPESQPVFDRSAALATARAMANDKDPARAGLAVAQFDNERFGPTASEKLGKAIASGHRKACIGREAAPGNLLTPLMWLIDKKGRGCKF